MWLSMSWSASERRLAGRWRLHVQAPGAALVHFPFRRDTLPARGEHRVQHVVSSACRRRTVDSRLSKERAARRRWARVDNDYHSDDDDISSSSSDIAAVVLVFVIGGSSTTTTIAAIRCPANLPTLLAAVPIHPATLLHVTTSSIAMALVPSPTTATTT